MSDRDAVFSLPGRPLPSSARSASWADHRSGGALNPPTTVATIARPAAHQREHPVADLAPPTTGRLQEVGEVAIVVLQRRGPQPGRHRLPPTREPRNQHQPQPEPTAAAANATARPTPPRATPNTLSVPSTLDKLPPVALRLSRFRSSDNPNSPPVSHTLEQANSQSITPPVGRKCRRSMHQQKIAAVEEAPH